MMSTPETDSADSPVKKQKFLPFVAEYAKSGRVLCKKCEYVIEKNSLRLAIFARVYVKRPKWYHSRCFFSRHQVETVDDIKDFDQLRVQDQERIKAELAASKESEGVRADVAAGDATLNDFKVEYAKSNRSTCRGCGEKIIKEAVRIAKMDYDSKKAKIHGPIHLWYHLQCFADKRTELHFFPSGSLLPGFSLLSSEEQSLVKEKIPQVEEKA